MYIQQYLQTKYMKYIYKFVFTTSLGAVLVKYI